MKQPHNKVQLGGARLYRCRIQMTPEFFPHRIMLVLLYVSLHFPLSNNLKGITFRNSPESPHTIRVGACLSEISIERLLPGLDLRPPCKRDKNRSGVKKQIEC